MEIIKQAASNEVYSNIKNNRQQAIYNLLQKIAPVESSFLAELKLSNSGPSWIHSESGWHSFCECEEVLKGLVESELAQRKKSLRMCIKNNQELSKIFDDIMTCPGEEYHFYRLNEVQQIEVLLTGWGYRKPVNRDHKSVIIDDPRNKVQSVSVRFIDYGQCVIQRPFALKLRKHDITRITNDEGLFLIGDSVLVGTKFTIRDTITGKSFTHEVVKGRSIYDCDVTTPKPSFIAFVNEGVRLANHIFFLTKDGQQKECQTKDSGLYELGDHLAIGSEYQIIDKTTGREFRCTIVEGQDLYEFDITKRGVSISIAFMNNGKRAGIRAFTVSSPEIGTKELQTQEDGTCKAGDKIEIGTPFHITDVGTGKEFDFSVIDGQILYEFDITVPYRTISIAFIKEGSPAGNRKFTICTPVTEIRELQSEPNGKCIIGNKIENGTQFHVIDIESQKEFDFTVVEGQDLYEFDITEFPIPEEPERMVRIRILDEDGVLVPGLKVSVLISKGNEISAETDNEGCIEIPASRFLPGKKFKVSFDYVKPSLKENKKSK